MNLIAAAFATLSLLFPFTAPDKRYEIPLSGSPSLGPADACVTLVEFIDFE